MGRKIVLLAMVAGAVAASSALTAAAGDRAGHDGHIVRRVYCGCVHHVVLRRRVVRRAAVIHEAVVSRDVVTEEAVIPDDTVQLPDTFFADAGGVGPAFVDYGGGSGGGVAIVEANAGGRASAFASASASASARISIAFNAQQHMQHMQMMKMHMGKMSHGGKW
jgi:hypothetical protein